MATTTYEFTEAQIAIIAGALTTRVDDQEANGDCEDALASLEFLDTFLAGAPVTKARERRRLELTAWRLGIEKTIREYEGE